MRWAMGVDYPQRIASPAEDINSKTIGSFTNTLVTSFDYGDKLISWEEDPAPE